MLYGESLYQEGEDNTAFFQRLLVESLPPAYRPTDFQGFNVRDFIERFLLPVAEDLNFINAILDRLDTYVLPETAPEEWLRWILTEWYGWTLIPENYPVARLRRLLTNLHLHYKRRYTINGLHLLLEEFGIFNEVYDRPIYVGGYSRKYGSRFPLRFRVRVLGYEAFSRPKKVYVGNYAGGRGLFAYTTPQIITERFVLNLVHWSRPASAQSLTEFVTSKQVYVNESPINDDDEIIIP